MAQVKAVPRGVHAVPPALTIEGCAEAMEFYKRALGAIELKRAPDPGGKKIWYGAMRIGDSMVCVNDAFPDMGATPNTSRIWIFVDAVDDAWKRATDAGMKVKMPLVDLFWGDRLGTAIDRWGNEWTLAQHVDHLSPDEIKQAEDDFIAEMKLLPAAAKLFGPAEQAAYRKLGALVGDHRP